ncbi:MAG: hypothetical protein ABIR62_15120 [Dokdonella sp.]|uniref:hypothetical protein n=1 Tax=Dokdonella sp. TaxID=2291710 RepID=UPI0032649A11
MDGAAPSTDSAATPEPDTFSAARAALDQAMRVAEAMLALLRSELRLARSSVLMLVWLGFALVFLGVGAWLATSAAIAAGIYQLTGNVFYGIGSVALANIVGVVVVLLAMRGCSRDLGLPRTRRALLQLGRPKS